MRRSLWATILFAALGTQSHANEVVEPTLKSKALASASASAVTLIAQAPFTQARDPLPKLLMGDEQEQRGFRGACQHSANDLCYDLADGRIVYRPIRRYMPTVAGLTPENITLRRDRVVIKYSFR